MNHSEKAVLCLLKARRRLLWDTKDMLLSVEKRTMSQEALLDMVNSRLRDVNQKIQEMEEV